MKCCYIVFALLYGSVLITCIVLGSTGNEKLQEGFAITAVVVLSIITCVYIYDREQESLREQERLLTKEMV